MRDFSLFTDIQIGRFADEITIKEILQNHPEVTRQDLVKQLGRHEDTIKQHLLELKKAGDIERIGSDRAGYWKVNERKK